MAGLTVSVCMATYNGIKHIEKQIDSILPQLQENDELIISDDGSKDGTLEYLLALKEKNNKVTIIEGPQRGANANFFNLIEIAQKDIILFADQDDIWFDNKIARMRAAFENNTRSMVVLHEDTIIYEKAHKEVNCNRLRHGLLKNLIKNSYSGHRMAIRQEFKKLIMKNTDKCPAYDMYLGLLAEKHKCGLFLNECLDKHIMHDTNVTKKLSLYGKIRIRMRLLMCIVFY